MKIFKFSQPKYSFYFVGLCLLQLVFWTLLPWLVRGCLPFDTVEAIAWGQQWMFGYDKHPPLAAWISAIAYQTGGIFGVYLLAQLAIILASYAVWRLAQRFFSPAYALLSVALLAGNLSFTLVSPNFNPTAMLVPLWALTLLVFYAVLKEERLWAWGVLGLLGALNILAKYEAAILFPVMLLLMVITREGRRAFKQPGLYLGLVLMLILLVPHFWYSYTQGFPEIRYGLQSTLVGYQGWQRIFMPLHMISNQLGTVALALVLILPLIIAKPKLPVTLAIDGFQKKFLWLMGLGPFVATLLLAALSGSRMDNNWFVPYFPLLGMMLVYWLKPVLTLARIRWFVLLWCVIFFGVLVGRYGTLWASPYLQRTVSSKSYFPAQAVANKLTALWRQRFQRPLAYIAGDHYLAAFVSVYAKDRPIPFMDWSLSESPWLDLRDLREKGAVFAWYADQSNKLLFTHYGYPEIPAEIKQRFPTVEYLGVYNFQPSTLAKVKEKVAIAIAVLPPSSS